MREKIESEQGWGYGYLVGLAGLAALSVYYAWAQHERETQVKSSGPSDPGKSEGVKITRDPAVLSATSRKLATLDNLG